MSQNIAGFIIADENDILFMSAQEIMIDTARLITALNAQDNGITRTDIEQGTYWSNCPIHGNYWAEDGCRECYDDMEEENDRHPQRHPLRR